MKISIVFLLFLSAVVLSGCSRTDGNTTTVDQGQSADSGKVVAGFSGKVLAGSTSPYVSFTKADYQKAKAEGKIVFLDFFANWCPICRAEAPEIKAGFDSLTRTDVVGFRVNYNDPDTDNDEKALAKQFNVPYQHTKIILKNGKEVFRSGDAWTAEDFSKAIGSY
jgi:thiol-disulfide isomerase/thioredoxin